jgi:hypothetical protein
VIGVHARFACGEFFGVIERLGFEAICWRSDFREERCLTTPLLLQLPRPLGYVPFFEFHEGESHGGVFPVVSE